MTTRIFGRAVVGVGAVLFGVFATAGLSADASATAPATGPAKVKVLIVDGFSNHNWKLNTKLLRGLLEPTGLFEVAVSTAPPTAAAPGWDAWRPKFSSYDVVIQTCNDIGGGPQWPEEVKTAFVAFVKKGGGVLAYHSGNNAFPKWEAYNEIIGIGWRTAAQGKALEIGADEKIIEVPVGEGRNTGHAPRAEVLVHRLGDHPIHAGLPRVWKSPGLEVYYSARGPAKNIEVLSYGLDPRYKQNWPLEWTVRYGDGRMYSSSFGHVWSDESETKQPVDLLAADEQVLLMRALQWLAKQPVTVAVPTDFPTAEKVSLRGPIPLPKD